MEVTIRVLGHEGRPVVFYSAHDITNRRETQFALQESERRFHDFFARSPIGIALYDASRKLTDVNPSALAMFGVSDRNHFVIHNLYEAPGLTAEARQTLIEGGTVRYEAVLDFDRRKVAGQAPSTRSGKCHFDILITNLRLDRDFSPKGFLVMLQDTTERRRAEEALRQNERMLRQSHKMEAIGTLAGGVAHDFNNILTPIIGHTEMAMLTCAPHDAVQDNLEEILKASHRAKDLVKQILMFSRQTEQEVRPIRLIPVINEVNTLLRGSITANVELQCVIQTNRDIVRADPTQVHQVLMNLGLNAIHAMKGKGGTLEIGLHMITVDARTKTNPARLRRGDYAELTVRDTGTGMDRATLDRIFEPFFTTKANGEGTGMGLAVVHGIISSLHGAITVDSEAGKGSTFHVFLPLLDEAEEQAVAPALTIPRGTETVLFVDDETDIVNMVGQMLKSLGYRPVTCTRGPQALDVFQKNPTQFDLLITDQVMPAMTGMQLVREIHLIRADLPVLLCTGFSRTTSDQELFDAGISEIIMKPILLRQFAEAVRRVLDTKAGRSKPAGVSASGKP
jgi:signal transduction histidine kinase/ActR/RegA family two-component response regulator